MSLLSCLKPVVERFPKLAAMYRGMRDQLDSMEEPVLTPWGFKLAGNKAMAEGSFEPIETEVVRKLLQDVDVLVNVGANVGYYCCHALSMGKEVIAFEPMLRNLHYLCKNMKTNGWEGVEIFPIALSNEIGVLEIYGGDTGASLLKGWADIPESYSTLVPCSTLDHILGERLQGKRALILVDIEGAEFWMLQGAKKVLASSPKPIWVVEITSKELQPDTAIINPNFKRTFELFLKYGYEAFDLENDMSPIVMNDIDKIFRSELELDSNNFCFIKK